MWACRREEPRLYRQGCGFGRGNNALCFCDLLHVQSEALNQYNVWSESFRYQHRVTPTHIKSKQTVSEGKTNVFMLLLQLSEIIPFCVSAFCVYLMYWILSCNNWEWYSWWSQEQIKSGKCLLLFSPKSFVFPSRIKNYI